MKVLLWLIMGMSVGLCVSLNGAPNIGSSDSGGIKVSDAKREGIPPGSYMAALPDSRGARYANWDVREDGKIIGTSFMTFNALLEQGAVSNDTQQKTLPILFDRNRASSAESLSLPVPVESASAMMAYFLVASPLSGRLVFPKYISDPMRLQWYGPDPKSRTLGVFWPERSGADHWPIVISAIMLSPGGPWRAPAKGDLDGDGRDDLAFVANGIDSCDRGPCPLYWIVILMTASHTQIDKSMILVRTDTLENFEKAVGVKFFAAGIDPYDGDAVAWRGRIKPGRYEVTAGGPAGKIQWSVTLRGGVLYLSPQPG